MMTTPVDVVRELYAKLSEGDAPGALALMTDDIEWIPMMDYHLDGRGPQKVLEGMLLPALAEWETFILAPSEFLIEGTRVVSIGRFRSKHRSTGKLAEVDYAHVWEVREGKISRFRQYIDTALIEAARQI
jgi:ketosteroid isomerase-like protein